MMDDPSDLVLHTGDCKVHELQPMPKGITFLHGDKELLSVNDKGEFIFNRKDFPDWKANDFAREFIECVEKATKV